MNELEVTPLLRGFAPADCTEPSVPRALAKFLSVSSAAYGAVVVQLVRRDHCEAVVGLIARAGPVPGAVGGVGAEGWHSVDGSCRDLGQALIPVGRRSGVLSVAAPEGERGHRAMLLIGSATDGPLAWLRAGEALERVRLILAHYDYASTPLTRVVEVPGTRAALRRGLGLTFQPQFVLLVGRGTSASADCC
jgi:hypothetical protein